MKMKVAVAIPTYNRKNLLERCLQAVSSQSLKPTCIYVVDNHSNDGTADMMQNKGYNKSINGVKVVYNYLPINGGGAMGFSVGMETAFNDDNYDAYWMLDDDGLPEKTCLEELCKFVDQYGYVSPVLMDINNPNLLNVSINGNKDPETLKNKYGGTNLLIGYCNPFNGGLFSHNAVKTVGFPKKELFIYGDEQNYHQRMIAAGFKPYGIFEARHLHPILDNSLVTNWYCVTYIPIKWKFYCICRNAVYNKCVRKEVLYVKFTKIIYYFVFHNIFFLFKKPSFSWLGLFYKSFFAGIFQLWGGQYKYMK